MSRARIERLASTVAELVARRKAETSAPLAAAELERAGFRVCSFWADGLAVDEAPGLDAKLDELRGGGISPALVCVVRRLDEETA